MKKVNARLYQEPVLWIVAGYANLPQLFWLAINDTYVGFMKRHSDYHVTIQRRVDPIRWTRAWRWRNGKFDCFKITR